MHLSEVDVQLTHHDGCFCFAQPRKVPGRLKFGSVIAGDETSPQLRSKVHYLQQLQAVLEGFLWEGRKTKGPAQEGHLGTALRQPQLAVSVPTCTGSVQVLLQQNVYKAPR